MNFASHTLLLDSKSRAQARFDIDRFRGALLAMVKALFIAVLAAAITSALASENEKIIVNGTVPDNVTKTAILSKLRELYGVEEVVDHLQTGKVATPSGWSQQVQMVIGPNLKMVRNGQLSIRGSTLTLRGNVESDAIKGKISAESIALLKPTYTFVNNLKILASQQKILDEALANRTIEFESGSAILTPKGMKILDEMVQAITQANPQKIDIVGHTDSIGSRQSNIELSEKRSNTVREFLISKGISATILKSKGLGPDQPIASNDSVDGRRRNRRIQFLIENARS